jgi:hypothetical protein
MGAEQPGFAISDVYVAFSELCPPFPQAFDLPAFEGETRFEAVLNKVVMPRFLVDGDLIAGRIFFICFVHEASFMLSSVCKGVDYTADDGLQVAVVSDFNLIQNRALGSENSGLNCRTENKNA